VPTVNSWDINFSDGDLLTHNKFGNGSYSWCQDSSDADPARRVGRGYGGVSGLGAHGSALADSLRGWRPKLKLSRV